MNYGKLSSHLSVKKPDPCSKSSSASPQLISMGLIGGLFLDSCPLFFPKRNLLILLCFLGTTGTDKGSFGGIMSTTRHVVSSQSPLAFRASCRNTKSKLRGHSSAIIHWFSYCNTFKLRCNSQKHGYISEDSPHAGRQAYTNFLISYVFISLSRRPIS